MNERIKQLALQAGDYVNEVYTPPVRSKTPGKIWEDGHVDWYTQFNEKFAELIVRECLALNKQVCLELHEDDQGLAGYKTMMNLYKVFLRNKIEEHFGVEE